MKSRKPTIKKTLIQATQFTSITNEFIDNMSISDNAKLLFIYLKRQSQNFEISLSNLVKNLNKSHNTITKAKQELKKKGYLNIIYNKTEKKYIYEIIDIPNKPKSKPKPTQKEINISKSKLENCRKDLNKSNISQESKQAFNSILDQMSIMLDREAE